MQRHNTLAFYGKNVNNLTFNIDYKQRGVGGDMPGTLGLHEQYKLHKGKTYRYSFNIRGYTKEEN